MWPEVRFLGLFLYDWCIILGIVAALVVARIYADKLKVPVKLQNFVFIVAFFAILAGLGSAVLFQAVYDFFQTGKFMLNENTGATFYGGFLGGAAVFLLLYFLLGKKLLKELPVQYFREVTGFAACAVALAHGIGRVGCFTAGCCYGLESDAFGLYFPAVGAKVIPTQLYEAIFLFLLFAVLTVLLFKTKISPLGIYLSAYAVFRFLLEFLRDDDRGKFFWGLLTPSQFWAVLLFLAGIALLVLFRPKKQEEPAQENSTLNG